MIVVALFVVAAMGRVTSAQSGLLWSSNASWAVSEPVIVDGAVVWATKSRLIAANATSGEVLWERKGVFSTPSTVDTDKKAAVVVSDAASGRVSMLYAADGRPKWSVSNVTAIGLQAPAIAAGGVVAVVLSSTGLVGISTTVGKVVWRLPTVLGDAQTRLTACGDTVFVAVSLVSLIVVDARLGTVRWTKSFPVIFSAVAIADTTTACKLVAVSLSTTVPPAAAPIAVTMGYDVATGAQAFDIPPYFNAFVSPAADGPSTILVASYQMVYHVLAETYMTFYNTSNTSQVVGSATLGFSGIPTSVPELGWHILGVYQGVSALSHLRQGGRYKWTVGTNGYVDHAPAVSVADNVVAVRDDAGYVYAMVLDPTAGN